jgi:hypothetical protein
LGLDQLDHSSKPGVASAAAGQLSVDARSPYASHGGGVGNGSRSRDRRAKAERRFTII